MYNESRLHFQQLEWIKEQVSLSSEQWKLIKSASLGVITMDEFERRVSIIKSETFLFCLDHPKGRMGQVGDRYKMLDWDKGLDKLQINRKQGFTEIFDQYMQAVVKSGNPIVFFVPPHIMDHEGANVTRYELLVLLKLENRAALKRTLFVYDDSLER